MSAELEVAKKDYKEKRALAEAANRVAYDAQIEIVRIQIEEDKKRREESEVK